MDDGERDARTDRLLRRLERAELVPEYEIDAYAAATALTGREVDVLRCLSYGLTPQMAGETLGISVHTVDTHRRHARYKLHAKNTTHACCLAWRLGLLD